MGISIKTHSNIIVQTSNRTVPGGPQGWGRSTSSMTPTSVQEELMARTPARVMEEVLWSVPPSTTLTPMYRLVWLHGVLAVGRMEPQECTPLLAMCARSGWMTRLLILRGRGMGLASMAGFLRLRFKDSSNALLPGKLHQPHWLTSLLLKESQRLIMELLTLRLTK